MCCRSKANVVVNVIVNVDGIGSHLLFDKRHPSPESPPVPPPTALMDKL